MKTSAIRSHVREDGLVLSDYSTDDDDTQLDALNNIQHSTMLQAGEDANWSAEQGTNCASTNSKVDIDVLRSERNMASGATTTATARFGTCNPCNGRTNVSKCNADSSDIFAEQTYSKHLTKSIVVVTITLALLVTGVALSAAGLQVGETMNTYTGKVQPQPKVDGTIMQLLCGSKCTVDYINQQLAIPLNTVESIATTYTTFGREVNNMYKMRGLYHVTRCTQLPDNRYMLLTSPKAADGATTFSINVDCTNAGALTAVYFYKLDWQATARYYTDNYGARIRGQDYVFYENVLPYMAVILAVSSVAALTSSAALGVLLHGANKKRWTRQHACSFFGLLVVCIVMCMTGAACDIAFVVKGANINVLSPADVTHPVAAHISKSTTVVYIGNTCIITITAIMCGVAVYLIKL